MNLFRKDETAWDRVSRHAGRLDPAAWPARACRPARRCWP